MAPAFLDGGDPTQGLGQLAKEFQYLRAEFEPYKIRFLGDISTDDGTYPFWQFGYWLGINKLAKKEELTYRQGNLAVLVFDNHLARELWHITPLMKGKFAHWAERNSPSHPSKNNLEE